MNKKIKNATKTVASGIEFKSKLEGYCYRRLIENGFKPYYERYKITIFPKEQIQYIKSLYWSTPKGDFKNQIKPLLPITYTPDFVFSVGNDIFIIETKGRPNDVYPYKRKIFLRWLERKAQDNQNYKFHFFEPKNQNEIHQMISQINDMTDLQFIRANFKALPGKDAPIAERLIEERDFVNLQELVHSDLVKIQKKRDKTQEEIDLEVLYLKLEDAITSYRQGIDGDDALSDMFGDDYE